MTAVAHDPSVNLAGRVVVVTGGARGMGRAYVEGFLSAGARVVAADKSWAGVEDFRGRVTDDQHALTLELDVTNDAQIDAALEATLSRFGTTDVLINNAALLQMSLVNPFGRITTLETTDEHWLKCFDVNVFGALKVTRRFIQPMIQQQRGSIINIVSGGIFAFSHGGAYTALRPWSREMPYMASKAALATMSFYLADEVKEHNVAVNILRPGHTRGSWFDDKTRLSLASGFGPGPQPVRPEHIVPVALHLAAQDAHGITGKLIDVLVWNEEHGLGGFDTWKDTSFPEDLQQAITAAGGWGAGGAAGPRR